MRQEPQRLHPVSIYVGVRTSPYDCASFLPASCLPRNTVLPVHLCYRHPCLSQNTALPVHLCYRHPCLSRNTALPVHNRYRHPCLSRNTVHPVHKKAATRSRLKCVVCKWDYWFFCLNLAINASGFCFLVLLLSTYTTVSPPGPEPISV